MATPLISGKQLKRLQVLYGQLARKCLDLGPGREFRLKWAAELVGHPVESFKALSQDDARHLIDVAQGTLGVRAPASGRLSREQAHRAGTDGRRDGKQYAAAPQLATASDLGRIQKLLGEMGWDQQRFAAFLGSARSPLKRKADRTIRTTADANKVWWALKRVAQQQGVWRGKGKP
jgi:hypothetical protein